MCGPVGLELTLSFSLFSADQSSVYRLLSDGTESKTGCTRLEEIYL